MEKRFEILPPTMPNFVRYGFKVDECFDIANFTQQEAEEFADPMRQTFMDHYAQRKASLQHRGKDQGLS